MFERYLSDVLTSYFGSMIENLDANQVRLSAWRGELALHDLTLRPNALDRLVGSNEDCPVEIAHGTIGTLELRIPLTSVWRWSAERTTSATSVECSVILDNVNILITPKTRRKRRQTHNDDDEVSLEERRMQKEHDVQSLLDAQLFERITKSSTTTTTQSSRWQWVRDLIKNVLSNLSIAIRNIHVRYEDAGMGFLRTTRTTPHGEAFSVGMTLHQFSVQTTDFALEKRQDEDSKLNESELPYTTRHKLAAAYHLAIYWDRGRGCHLMTANAYNINDDILQVDSMDSMQSEAKLVEHEYFEQAFQVLNGEATSNDDFCHEHLYNVHHTYLLSPVSPSMDFALVTENPRDHVETHPLIPPSTVNMTFPPCHLTISANTLEDTAYLRKSLAVWRRTRKSSISEASVRRLTGLRPSFSPLEDPKPWWRYAVEATLVLERRDSSQNKKHWRPRGWSGLARAIQRRRDYVRLYETVLSSEDAVDRENAHCELIQMEDDLLLEEIVAFRQSVYYLVTKPARLQKPASEQAASSLTWTEWVRGKAKEEPVDLKHADGESDDVPLEDIGMAQLSVDHRRRMHSEMTDMLEREESNQMLESSLQRSEGSSLSVTDVEEKPNLNVVVWKTSMAFKEISIQINERVAERSTGYELRPAVKLSCALLQRQTLYRSEAWEVDSAIASLQVVDLTGGSSSSSGHLFPVLLGRRLESVPINDGQSNDSVEIGGTMHSLSASVSVRRTIQSDACEMEKTMHQEAIPTTTTYSVIRLMPHEVVYSTNPVAALTRALSTMRTPELADDYNRVVSVMARWRNRQKSRLLRALAHKRKKIVVDVDIAAPVVLIPEDPNKDDSPLLVIDLGRLRFSNADNSIESGSEYDDKWKLALDEIQVECSSTALYRMNLDKKSIAFSGYVAGSLKSQKLVEPFSLHFIISTRIANEETDAVASDGTFVNVSATLPRLVFNLTSSAVRLVERLKLQWAQRAQTSMSSTGIYTGRARASGDRSPRHEMYMPSKRPEGTDSSSVRRRIKFSFSAPMVGFRLENDVDGRELSDRAGTGGTSCPLVHIALKGIQGEFMQAVESREKSTSTFDARLRSITAVDLYQKAGDDFALLLSSRPPSTLSGQLSSIFEDRAFENAQADNKSEVDDLVSVRYISSCSTPCHSSSIPNDILLKDTLALTFYELYVEWNPETIAAIHKGMLLPKVYHNETADQSLSRDGADEVSRAESEDEFYDAIESADASDTTITSSKREDEESDVQVISEVSSRVSSVSDVTELTPQIGLNFGVTNPSSPFLYSGEARPILGGSSNLLLSPLRLVGDDASAQKTDRACEAVTTTKSFEVTFKLTALRVNFNKDSRHRRVVTAGMEDTEILYLLQQSGKSRTKAKIGNLSFTDPSSAANTTLYKEILGLKAGSANEEAASLLEMDLSLCPRKRHLVASGEEFDATRGVAIDTSDGTVRGSDMTVSMHFSPMRFVYLQQFWMEIIDYFFEGIVGYEVWGKEKPLFNPESSAPMTGNGNQREASRSQASSLKSNVPGILAEEFSFTRFDVQMDEPTVLIPVSYSSPHFLRLEFASLTAANYYQAQIVDAADSTKNHVKLTERVQWYNNCTVQLHDLKLTSWEGSVISGSGAGSSSASSSRVVTDARIQMNWPAGRWAPLVVPKWKVDCDIDRMVLCLRRENYALLQHIIMHNIGEVSRHLEEWNALQRLPPSQLETFKKEFMVHFGYDKKDTAPTTYAISVKVPSIKFYCLGSSSTLAEVIMDANCTSVEWQMRKASDRISRQRVTCDIALTKPAGGDPSREANAVDLLLPVNDSTETYGNMRRQKMDSAAQAATVTRELSYTSTTQPSGDNVRTLEIVDACIFAIYPAWNSIKQFFSNLPEPDFMSPDEVGLAMQIGDRWYRIGGNRTAQKAISFMGSVNEDRAGLGSCKEVSLQVLPSYQFHLLLKSPRIVVPSGSMEMESSCVVLRMEHFDFFHHNDGHSRRIRKTFFVHDLELYTSSIAFLNRSGYVDESSLIRPWCIAGHYVRCDSRTAGPCNEHGMRIKGDVLQARAAYSDMSVAIDVGLRFFSDLQESQSRTASRYSAPSGSHSDKAELSGQSRDVSSLIAPCSVPQKSVLAMELDGFELEVVDDSMRHFAEAQQLIKLSLLEMSLYQVAHEQHDKETEGRKKRTKVSLHRVSVFDCLQPIQSPFRLVATSRRPSTETGIHQTDSELEGLDMHFPRMSWSDFRTIEDGHWGFIISHFLVERTHGQALTEFCETDYFDRSRTTVIDKRDEIEQSDLDLLELHHLYINGVSDEYAVNLRSLTIQWNPSTVIALQRFLGRLHKEAKTKSEGKWTIPRAPSTPKSDMSTLTSSDSIPTHAHFQMERLTIFLNKEHQHRCLVRATLTESNATFEHDARRGTTLQGSIKDLSAWDTDTSTARGRDAVLEEHRMILQVITSDKPLISDEDPVAPSDPEFLRFRFLAFAGSDPSSISEDELPSWVDSRLRGSRLPRRGIDDYLSVSVATVRVCYIRDRIEEILDYLSNGLPGKGMGATSKAAKGFISKRIQTKSYLELNIKAPQMFVPQHEKSYRGILVRLGDVNARSWFEDANDEMEANNKDVLQQSIWYRVLSISLTGLDWNANERDSSFEVDGCPMDAAPLDVVLEVRKPTSRGSAVVVRGSLSCVELALPYTTFMLLNAVMRDNISREIDMTRWDNVEKAYWMEEDVADQPTYSSSARFIHYGKERRQKAPEKETHSDPSVGPVKEEEEAALPVPKLDCLLNLDGLRLKLRRNDPLEGLDTLASKGSNIESSFCYDIVVLRADSIEILLNTNSVGDKSLQISLCRIGVFDLGDSGRLARARYHQTLAELDSISNFSDVNFQAIRDPCAFSALVEGYSPSEEHMTTDDNKDHTAAEPQILLTIDTCSASSAGLEDSVKATEDVSDKIILARMVFNYLSVNALILPLQEVLAFLTCSWSLRGTDFDSSIGDVAREVDDKGEESIDLVEERAKPDSFRKGLQLKLVAHYPRVFFLADESDPCSRALVLRGLAVLDASIVDQETVVKPGDSISGGWKHGVPRGFCDKKVVTAVNAQLHSMETYINPNVENALGLDGHNPDIFDQSVASAETRKVAGETSDEELLGVALIQPVTAGIEFCQIRRDRFPTLESLSVNMEPVSTMLSFEDLTLLEAILERWSQRTVKRNALSIKGSSSYLDSPSMLKSMVSPSSVKSDEVLERGEQMVSYDVTFKNSRLGLVLTKASGAIVVENLQSASEADSVQIGDILTSINGVTFESPALDEVVELLCTSPRPVTVSFSRKIPAFPSTHVASMPSFELSRSFSRSHEESASDDSVDAVANEGFADDKRQVVYTLAFRRGTLNGLIVEPSPCGSLPVLIDVLPSFFLDAISIDDETSGSVEMNGSLAVRLPRTGAVIAEIDGKPSSEIGYSETKELLGALSSKTTDANAVKSDATFSVKFLELDASEWGKIRTADISITGVTLTFIDDFKGRDMPLLRGKLEGTEIHMERGIGIEPRAVVAAPPDVLDLSTNGVDSRDELSMIRLLVQIEADYYHPRNALWEPLLEPSNICFMVERQLGSDQRPGQLAMEASDSLFDGTDVVLQAPVLALAPRVISLNLSDAAAEVVVRSIKEWRDWRQRTIDRQEADIQSLGILQSQTDESLSSLTDNTTHDAPLPPTAQTVSPSASNNKIPAARFSGNKAAAAKARHAAAQKAAKAALEFAQKRGAGTKEESESSKPFVFRNRTGMSLSFVQEGPSQNENGHIEAEEQRNHPFSPIRGVNPTFLEDSSEARFHMDVISQEQRLKDESFTKRVRAYDGQYPSLCVIFEAVHGIAIKPLGNLPAFKVGNTIRRLEVLKRHSGAEPTQSSKEDDETDGYTEFSVPLVWTVEIEDNRRILTLSTSVRVISSGVSLSIDVGIRNSSRQEMETADKSSPVDTAITEVGTAKSGSPFYIPLWLALKCQVVDVFVKPSGLGYSWSQESVLSFIPIQAMGDKSSLSDWEWKENFESSCSVSCDPPSRDVLGARTLWLSCVSLPHVGGNIKGKDVKKWRESLHTSNARGALISIAVDAGLTIRNMLPAKLQWEVATFESLEPELLDSFSNREKHESASHLFERNGYGLQSGEGVEILPFCLALPDARARFRCHSNQDWSKWAQLSPSVPVKSRYRPVDKFEDNESRGGFRQVSDGREMYKTRQLNVQIRDEFGVPLTLGVRVVPKLTEMQNGGNARCFGYDVIVFAECWIRNLTPLALSFGCPSAQINASVGRDDKETVYNSDEAGIINAEAALLEIASILELGERGKGLNLRDNNASVSTSDTYLLPYQTADLIVEEVFEYVEVENMVVKRRWWASEKHDSRRQDPSTCSATGKGWHWIDDHWKIDCSGQNLRASDGWESCRSLIGGKDDYFSRRRMFIPSHPFRRRRWFRRRGAYYRPAMNDEELLSSQLYGDINAFHHPVNDAFTRVQKRTRDMQKKAEQNAGSSPSGTVKDIHAFVDEEDTKISIKCSDGQWSSPCIVPQTGVAHGVVRVPASRWPTLTKLSNKQASEMTQAVDLHGSNGTPSSKDKLSVTSLSPALYELCYKVADLGDDWGELTRMFLLTPRFMLRNDSPAVAVEVKQSGAPDETAVAIQPGVVVPFFWADFRLPELVSVRPLADDHAGNRKYRWSGGFDICSLGMTSVRLRRSRLSPVPRESGKLALKSIRTLVEIRSGTGGTGINVSFREEDPSGKGSLFRIENQSPFRIWIAQDGVLANPSAMSEERKSRLNQGAHGGKYNRGHDSIPPERRFLDDHARTDGDMIEAGGCSAFALDVPFRQGKYAGRKAASMEELTRIRVGLAPLSSRDGVESTKVVSLSTVGESVRLSPAKLSSISGFDIRTHLVDLRVLGIVTTDGPTRVLRFCMMRKADSSGVFDYALSNIASSTAFRNSPGGGIVGSRGRDEYLQQVTLDSAMKAIEMDAPVENDAIRLAFFGGTRTASDFQVHQGSPRDLNADLAQEDTVFSFRASFCGFSCSLIDRTPSEIALVTLKDVSVSASWNKKRTTDGTALITVGWLQVDNYVPSAPFPVAVCPAEEKIVERGSEVGFDSDDEKSSPLLIVGLSIAPKHKSGILCVKSASIAPRDLTVSIDLAFVVRLQQFFVGIHGHLRSALAKDNMTDRARSSLLLLRTETRQFIPFPDIESMVQQIDGANATGVGSQKLYFEGLTILPCNVNLSVAPARALTSAQASLEGNEAAALHAAVRKGDLLVGGGMLGVNIGHKNKTAVAVVRGVFKSIIVDALLRCEAASLNFSGVYLRNYISTGPQLKTFLGAHYMESLKSNVPALLGSMAALGNPLGLIRGIGDGMSDFVSEPVKGLRKSMEELDPSYVVGGFARGTQSLARHAVGGFAGSASLLTETFSKNMAVITLDRRYAQRRDRRNTLRSPDRDIAVTFFEGVESGAVKLVRGVWDGVTGVVRAPLRGAERHGMEGFAKGVGKGLLGLLVKPMIGLSDAATDVMIGVQGSVEGKKLRGSRHAQVRPRRPMYGPDRILRPYTVADAAAATLMLRTKLAGENYLSHCDMDDQVALLSVKRMLLLASNGQELMVVKYNNIEEVCVEPMPQRGNGNEEWSVMIVLKASRMNERPVHVIKCRSKAVALELCAQLKSGVSLADES